MKELWRNDMRRGGTRTLAAPFPCGSGDSDRGLFSHTGVWVGAVSLSAVNTRLTLSRGWGLKHILHFFLLFTLPFFNRQVINILGLTLILHKCNLDFIDVDFYLYWKKRKKEQNQFLPTAALQRLEEKGL